MQTIITLTDLRNAILQLENQQVEEGRLLKEQFRVAIESIKPINLIKSAFTDVAESTDLQDSFLNSTIGISAGYLSKIFFQGTSSSPLKKILGTALMFGIKNLVAQNPETVKLWGKAFFQIVKKILLGKEEKPEHNEPEGSTYD